MNHKQTDICTCGCKLKDHDLDGTCYGCFNPPMVFNCEKFKLDNLKYVEEEAKKRKLV